MVSECDQGALYDTRVKNWSSLPALRPNYSCHHREINSVADLKATLRAGPFAFPGGYPLFLITSDGGALCFKCGKSEFYLIAGEIQDDDNGGWRVVACEINHGEESDLNCDHCSKLIE